MDVRKITSWKWGEMGTSDDDTTIIYVTDAKQSALQLMMGQELPPIIVQDKETAGLVCEALNALAKQRAGQ